MTTSSPACFATTSVRTACRSITSRRAWAPSSGIIATGEPYDIVLLDVMLPGIDGFEVCRRRIRARSAVPIVMLTARGDDADRVVGLEIGADDYLPKPSIPASSSPACAPSCGARSRPRRSRPRPPSPRVPSSSTISSSTRRRTRRRSGAANCS